MKIGSEVPVVTWTALRWVLRLGMARPSTRPSAIARRIQSGRNRSRNDRRVMTGSMCSTSTGGCSEATLLTRDLR